MLNILFTLVFLGLFALTLRRGARDPVCGMTVDRGKALAVEHGGSRWYFCGPGCRDRFLADPDRYASGSPPPREPAHAHHHH